MRASYVIGLCFSLGLILVGSSVTLAGPGWVGGVIGIIDKVVFEPNEDEPERVQIWGVFTLDEVYDYGPPKRGYLYYSIFSTIDWTWTQAQIDAYKQACRSDWAKINGVAGTGKVITFINVAVQKEKKGRIRNPDEKPREPDAYPYNSGYDAAAVVEEDERFNDKYYKKFRVQAEILKRYHHEI